MIFVHDNMHTYTHSHKQQSTCTNTVKEYSTTVVSSKIRNGQKGTPRRAGSQVCLALSDCLAPIFCPCLLVCLSEQTDRKNLLPVSSLFFVSLMVTMHTFACAVRPLAINSVASHVKALVAAAQK